MAIEESKEVTAYSIYSKQAKARTKINPLEDIYPKLPEKKYQRSEEHTSELQSL